MHEGVGDMRYLLITYTTYKSQDYITSVKASNSFHRLVEYAFEYTVKHTTYTPYYPPIQPMLFSTGEISCSCPEVLAHIYSKKWASVLDTECNTECTECTECNTECTECSCPTTPICVYEGTQDPRLFSTCERKFLQGV
jgi:hypothetical protein